jgi:hypothetical protein
LIYRVVGESTEWVWSEESGAMEISLGPGRLMGAFNAGVADDVEYVVRDIESLVFWLGALDVRHTDTDGSAALASAATLNKILAGNTDHLGFVTNEHRYLAVAQQSG